jgi:hypothetical protein
VNFSEIVALICSVLSHPMPLAIQRGASIFNSIAIGLRIHFKYFGNALAATDSGSLKAPQR